MKTLLIISALVVGQTSPYEAAKAEALRTHKFLAVGVGCAPPSGEWMTVMVRGLEGVKGPTIIIARGWWTAGDESSKHLRHEATLLPTATADDIRRTIGVPTERPQPPGRKKYNPATQERFQGRMK